MRVSIFSYRHAVRRYRRVLIQTQVFPHACFFYRRDAFETHVESSACLFVSIVVFVSIFLIVFCCIRVYSCLFVSIYSLFLLVSIRVYFFHIKTKAQQSKNRRDVSLQKVRFPKRKIDTHFCILGYVYA